MLLKVLCNLVKLPHFKSAEVVRIESMLYNEVFEMRKGFLNQYATINLFTRQEMPADGNCLFHCILAATPGIASSARQLRNDIASFMKEKILPVDSQYNSQLPAFIKDMVTSNLRYHTKALRFLRIDKWWKGDPDCDWIAEQILLYAIANYLQTPIVVHSVIR
jgi:hypothetical protein